MQDSANDRILFSWRMPRLPLAAKKAFSIWMVCLPVLWVLVFGLRAVGGICALVLMSLIVLGLSAFFYSFYSRVVQEVVAVALGLRLTLFSGKVETIRWSDMRVLRSGQSFAANLRSENHRIVYFDLPRETMSDLISIIREHSNARITGFD